MNFDGTQMWGETDEEAEKREAREQQQREAQLGIGPASAEPAGE